MSQVRLELGRHAWDWWAAKVLPRQADIVLRWNGDVRLRLGQLTCAGPHAIAFRYDPSWPDELAASVQHVPSKGATPSAASPFDVLQPVDLNRLIACALTCAGWLRPMIEPAVLADLISLRAKSDTRVEFIFDTNALSQGIGHWLATIFADRCDLVYTAVSLRELQDLGDRAGYGKELKFKPWANAGAGTRGVKVWSDGEWLTARQCYDAARRFVEFTGLRHPRWRELDLEDTALLLSRGANKHGEKDSGADSMLLRQVRRAIQDRVRGMERFFVTGDFGLARRAATELPAGSTLFSRVREVAPKGIYYPCPWWPGPDDGSSLGGAHGPRLVRELLGLCDTLDVVTAEGDGYRFSGWRPEMGLADYERPWLTAEQLGAGWPTPPPPVTISAPSATQDIAAVPPIDDAQPGSTSPLQPPAWANLVPTLDDHLRVRAKLLFDVLAIVAANEGGGSIPVAGDLLTGDHNRDVRQRRAHLATLLKHVGLGDVNETGDLIMPGPRHARLVDAWTRGDRATVFWLLSPYRPLWQAATGDPGFGRLPEAVGSSAQAIAGKLGFVAKIGGEGVPGAGTPAVAQIRSAVMDWVTRVHPQPLTVLALLREVFLGRLGVSPSRVIDAWDDLRGTGVFDGLEFSRGLASTGRYTQEIIEFTPGGWRDGRLDIESVRGARDIVWTEGDLR